MPTQERQIREQHEVLAALALQCNSPDCPGCPYHEYADCRTRLKRDAAATIRTLRDDISELTGNTANDGTGQQPEKSRPTMQLKLDVTFATDGDFCFDDADTLFDPMSTMYDGADITYGNTRDDCLFAFGLEARGDADACQYAARDLLETLMCSLRAGRYYVIQDIYRLLIGAKDQCLWKDGDVEYDDGIGGNYEGTRLRLSITRQH